MYTSAAAPAVSHIKTSAVTANTDSVASPGILGLVTNGYLRGFGSWVSKRCAYGIAV